MRHASLIFFGVLVAVTFAETAPPVVKQSELAKDLRTRVEWEQRLRKE